ncbi:MAG: hypothetical protein L0229_16130 [Blastocatellia bacterium]|nr:hypothetical protein [Blastocatellia bacterium]
MIETIAVLLSIMPSKNILASLPNIDSLKKVSRSLAMLDAILSPEWEYRYFSFNSHWGPNEMMASMRNGCGDEYFILFNPVGAILKGFAHESVMSPYANESGKPWPGVVDEVPNEFQHFLKEPAFSINDVTFCIWRKYGERRWQTGNIDYPEGDDPDGSEELLFALDSNPSTYQEFAQEYFERDIDLSAIEHVYRHKPLTEEIIKALNADILPQALKADIDEIDYPGGTNKFSLGRRKK